jgi:hypothetical protein
VQGKFESIEKASSKDGIIGLEHVDNIESVVFYVRVLQGAK